MRKLSTANAATRRFFDQASKRAEELYGEFNNGAWKDEAWWRQDLIPQSRLSVNVPEETDDDEHQRRREDATRAAATADGARAGGGPGGGCAAVGIGRTGLLRTSFSTVRIARYDSE